MQQTQANLSFSSFYINSVNKGLLLISLLFITQLCKAEQTLTYTVKIVNRANADLPYKDRTIVIEAKFIADSSEKQQLQIRESGLDEMKLQAQLVINGVKQGQEVTEQYAKIQYQGVCHNPVTKQANAIFYVAGNAASVDSSALIALTFNKTKQQMQVISATDGAYSFGDNFDLLKCEAGQKFTTLSGKFKPCHCEIN